MSGVQEKFIGMFLFHFIVQESHLYLAIRNFYNQSAYRKDADLLRLVAR